VTEDNDQQRREHGGIVAGFGSLLTGLKITTGKIFKPKVTLEYPHQKVEMSEAFRSCIAFVRFEDIDTHDCIACDACAIICPSDCITVTGDRMPDSKKKRADRFDVDFSTCSLCGLCLAACPTDTLKYSADFDDAGYQRGWVQDLLEPFDDPPIEELAKTLTAREERKKAERKAAREAAKAAKAAAKAKQEESGNA
tara:strand:+ start:1669 stop:2256 length:588 start_codon:yes stop_codon:yes gene_type:complete